MRFIGRGTCDEPSTVQNADIVVQIGDAKTALKADQLLGSNVRFSRSMDFKASKPTDPYQSMPEDEDRALKALERMQQALTPKSPDAGAGPWSPYSPDDCYPYDAQPKDILCNDSNDSLPQLHRQPSDANLPAYYDSAEQPCYASQQTYAVRDMAVHKGAPTIFDSFQYPYAGDSKTSSQDKVHVEEPLGHTRSSPQSNTNPLGLMHLLPLAKQSKAGILSSSRLPRSPSAMPNRIDLPLPTLPGDSKLRKCKTTYGQRPTTSGDSGRSKPFDEDVLDQHKTHVRRPPKGIQNWFDAYLDDDDDDDDDDPDLEAGVDEQEPQELPAEDVLPPAYSASNRKMSRASEKSIKTPHDSHQSTQQIVEHTLQQAGLNRHSSSSTANSIQSSHLERTRTRLVTGSKLAASILGRESVLSLSDSECESEDEDGAGDDIEDTERCKLPAIRDSILDAREITIANATSVDVLRLHMPTQTSICTQGHDESRRGSPRSSGSATQKQDKPLPMPPLQQDQTYSSAAATADPVSLRRLNGLSLESGFTTGTTETSNSGMTGETQSSGTSFHDTGNASLLDLAHMMAVTDEERMLLDLIRQKRLAMQQMSFTEGYQLALRTEQQRLAKRTASAEQRALRALKKKESSEQYRASDVSATLQTPTQETEMKRQLSAIRKEQVDERFQMERFLGMSQPQPLSSHPPDTPRDSRVRAPSGEVLPATRYSPAMYSTPSHVSPEINPGHLSPDECETASARMRVQQFINSKGAPPPLNSGMKTMRRHNMRQPTSLPPSPVAEETQFPAPPLPPRSSSRVLSGQHERNISQFTVSTLKHKPSSSSLHDEPRDRSPVSAFSGGLRRQPSVPQLQAHDPVLLPPRPDAPTHAQFVSKSSSTPHLSFSTGSGGSPFGALISAASRVSAQQSPYRPASMESLKSAFGKQPETRAPLPRLNTVYSVLATAEPGARESLLSITSAGEEVLGAWAELGGGREGLQVKRRS